MSINQFGPVWCASGARNFFGEGWWFHRIFKILFPFWFTWEGATLVTKTTTYDGRDGNMPLTKRLQPKEWFPICVVVSWVKNVALNAVGLSGPGAEPLFCDGRWQQWSEPFQISFGAQGETLQEKLDDFRRFLKLFLQQRFSSPVMLQVNESCPNTEHFQQQLEELIREINAMLGVAHEHDLQIIIKLNALFPPERITEFTNHPACAAICCSNTIPWGETIPWLPEDDPRQIDWDKLFGTGLISPLKRLLGVGGGLSGEPLKEIVCEWVRRARKVWDGHINGCGGILRPSDVDDYFDAGASSVSLGSIGFLRPWRMRATRDRAYARAA
ncbi:MAG: hypothetical protein WDZ79_01500 [Candidatus Paceibacterota bacterium]